MPGMGGIGGMPGGMGDPAQVRPDERFFVLFCFFSFYFSLSALFGLIIHYISFVLVCFV